MDRAVPRKERGRTGPCRHHQQSVGDASGDSLGSGVVTLADSRSCSGGAAQSQRGQGAGGACCGGPGCGGVHPNQCHGQSRCIASDEVVRRVGGSGRRRALDSSAVIEIDPFLGPGGCWGCGNYACVWEALAPPLSLNERSLSSRPGPGRITDRWRPACPPLARYPVPRSGRRSPGLAPGRPAPTPPGTKRPARCGSGHRWARPPITHRRSPSDR